MMRKVRNVLKSVPWIRQLYFACRPYFPQVAYLENNRRKVYEFDKTHGTDFSEWVYQDELGISEKRANSYSPSPKKLVETLDCLEIHSFDSIVDLGCGKGFAMYQMANYPFGKIGGVELSYKLYEIANRNLEKVMPANVKWEICNCDAGIWDGYNDYNYFYMFNPFPNEVLYEVKKKIDDSIEQYPRKVTVLYLMPRCAEAFLEDTERWRLVKRGSRFEQKRGMHIFVCDGGKDND